MKAYIIQHHDIVAAHNQEQAVGTWMAYSEIAKKPAGLHVLEIDPTKFLLLFERNDGSFEKGSLSEIMPEDGMAPEVFGGGARLRVS